MIRGFYIGRFQPYHNGHDKIIRSISKEVDELVIGIGSAQKSHSAKDPFMAGERIEMIRKSLEDIDDLIYYIIPLQDLEFSSLWVSHVRCMSPKFDVVYSNNPLVIQLFKEAGADIRRTPLHDRKQLSGTKIRQLMVDGDNTWKNFVPPAVTEVIEEINGIERIKAVSSTDNKYSEI